MADRTSAKVFGKFFEHLAKEPTEANKTFAKTMLKEARNYDFNFYQMYCDEALTTLGLTKETVDEPGEPSYIVYLYEDYEEQDE